VGLVNEQWEFLKDLATLISWAEGEGYVLTGGELQRTEEQQEIYIKAGKSKTRNSMHLKKLAIDMSVFMDGVLLIDPNDIAPLGQFWEGLNIKNRWGGSWRGLIESGKSKFVDAPHFERYIP
jgi:peptidoglycan L-alanyl-D-glutamate endopeptidase CwlK